MHTSPLTLNFDKLLPYAHEQLGHSGEMKTLRVTELARFVYRVDLAFYLPDGRRKSVAFVQKFTYRDAEVHMLELLGELPSLAAKPRLLDTGSLFPPQADQPEYWFVTPFYAGSPLTFEDEVPSSIINLLAEVHVHFAQHVGDFDNFYQVNATTFRQTFDNALEILEKALHEKPHPVFGKARACLNVARTNERLYAALAALPLTLTHGDVHPGNMLVTPDGQATLIDWGNVRVAPAMLDLANMVAFDSPTWRYYLTAWAKASGTPLDPRLAQLGYDWATVMINTFYLPYAVDFRSPEHVQSMVDKVLHAQERLNKIMG